ncbi:MAG: hypothetical protein WKF31_06395 [Thermoleophilaceae bacterium]
MSVAKENPRVVGVRVTASRANVSVEGDDGSSGLKLQDVDGEWKLDEF